MRDTKLRFTWTTGTVADNMIKVFNENGIKYFRSHLNVLKADFYGVGDYKAVGYEQENGNTYKILMEV